MKLIVGLGNPGKEYEQTRHNIGFTALDAYEYKTQAFTNSSWTDWGKQTESDVAQQNIQNEKIYLQKPMTYMNLSGMAVVELANYYKISPKDICVIYDEMDLPLGSVHLKVGGGTAGHKGIKSIVENLGTPDFARIRLGIGRPQKEVVDFVLEKFSKSEKPEVDHMISQATIAIEEFIKGSEAFRLAMNVLNRKA